MQLIRAFNDRRLADSKELREALFTCLDCRACETACPNDIHPGQLSLHKRAELMPDGLPRRLRRILTNAPLLHAGMMEFGMGAMRILYQQTGLRHWLRSSGLLHSLPKLERLDRYLPEIPRKPARASLAELVPAAGVKKGVVGYFLGCAMNVLFPEAALSAVRVLSLLGYDVLTPRGIVCCGAPQMTMGEIDSAKEMARRNMRAYDEVEIIVTDCAACGAEMKGYANLLNEDQAVRFSAKVRDFAEFVEPFIDNAEILPGSYTWHAPCHLAHAQGICDPPKRILKQIAGEFLELTEEDRCCGSAGIYWLTNPQIADNALDRKLRFIRETSAETIVTSNPGCVLQLLAGKSDTDEWKVKYLSEVLEVAMQGRKANSESTQESDLMLTNNK